MAGGNHFNRALRALQPLGTRLQADFDLVWVRRAVPGVFDNEKPHDDSEVGIIGILVGGIEGVNS